MVDPITLLFGADALLGLGLAIILYRTVPCWLRGDTIEPESA